MILNTRARSAAAGFTLIELLVVISILVILMALTGVVYTKAIEGQRNRSTDDLANRLQPALEAEYQAVVQQAEKDIRNNVAQQQGYSLVLNYCDNDADRARAVWTAAKLRQHFPETFAEAKSVVQVCPTVQLQPLTTFLSADVPSGGGTTELQSAALLYVILAKKSAGGSGGFQADDVTSGMQMDLSFNGVQARVFRDGWGNPMAFKRWVGVLGENNNEVQSQPYVDAKKDIKINPTANRDPLDTVGKVISWAPASGQPNPFKGAPYWFIGQNRQISVYSSGKNGVFENFANDDLAGFRIRRLGNRGR